MENGNPNLKIVATDPSKKRTFWKNHGKKIIIGSGAVALGIAAAGVYYACRSVGVDATEALEDIKDAVSE